MICINISSVCVCKYIYGYLYVEKNLLYMKTLQSCFGVFRAQDVHQKSIWPKKELDPFGLRRNWMPKAISK